MINSNQKELPNDALIRMAADIVIAYLGKNPLPFHQTPDLIQSVYSALSSVENGGADKKTDPQKPAIAIKKSVTPDYIVCLEDGRKLKMLKRHLRSTYNMTPDEYRVKWGLPSDYPMVAPNYAAQRSHFAKNIGLGRKGDIEVGAHRSRKKSK